MSERPLRRRILRVLLAIGGTTAFGVGGLLFAYREAFGSAPSGERLARMEASPRFRDGVFVNDQPMWNGYRLMLRNMMNKSAHASPADPAREIPVESVPRERFASPPASGLRVTWFGHSSMLVEIDGIKVLTDPVWGDSPSPIPWLGPQRWYAPPIALDDLPRVDAVLISHDHYDHLDHPTIDAIKDWDTVFYAPLGVGAHLEGWGIPAERIVEMDWWDEAEVGDVTLVCAPSRHASGRGIQDQMRTLWAGYALVGPEHRVFYSGDTGLFDGMREIGARLGPFDLTMLEVGAYDQAWPDWHLGPEQAVLAHTWLRGRVLLPVHWGLFDLANHGWTEPIERVAVAARALDVTVMTPPPGGSVEPTASTESTVWWPEVPYRTAEESPIVANLANGRPAHAD